MIAAIAKTWTAQRVKGRQRCLAADIATLQLACLMREWGREALAMFLVRLVDSHVGNANAGKKGD